MTHLLITLLIGSVGGLAGYKLRLPAGALLGSMVTVAIYNCLGFEVFMPTEARVIVQILVGCLLGLSLNRETFMQLKTAIKPAIAICLILLTGCLITGFILFKFCKLDIYTAFLSSTAGGMTELTLLAVTLGGDGPKVAILHLIRMITVVSTMPVLLHIVEKLLLRDIKKEPV